MKSLLIFIILLSVLGALALLTAYICYRMAFYAPYQAPLPEGVIDIPEGAIYEPFRERMEHWAAETRTLPHEVLEITTFDGLTLSGNYYEYSPEAPVELMFHGYRGTAERDLSGGVQRCFRLGHSALIVHQRCSRGNPGKVITFGVNEHRDCLAWVQLVRERFGPDVKILLTGISMGAATVLMAAGTELPENVIGVLADCGYTSPKEIIKKVIRQLKLPADLIYPFVKLGARLFGHFNLEETSPLEAMSRCKVPVLFFHGETDDFVPCEMSRANYAACTCRKKLVTVPGAGHGLCYPMATETYLQAVCDFFHSEKP